ncbi:MAG: efflux RND transporter periplasmic adaptor subunit [Candidatus Zixiibacteriota bacterium]
MIRIRTNIQILLLTMIAGLVAVVSGCQTKQAGGFQMPPTPVEIATVESNTVSDRFEAVGSIDASEMITVVSEIDALVIALPFREGAPIGKGDLIAQLDDSKLAAELARAEATFEQSRANFERVKSVVEQKAAAPQDLDDAAAELKRAEADLAFAHANLMKTKIVAPFSGVVGARRVSPGAFLRAGSAITDLTQFETIKVMFSAPERYYPSLTKGSEVEVSTTAFPNYKLRGTIDVVEPMIDQTTRSVRIIAKVLNPEGKFRPGMSANVTAILKQRENALLIPDEAIFSEGNLTLVYVVKPDSTVTRTPITLGTRMSDVVEVLEGLKPGEQVVRAGHQKLHDGAKIMPVTLQPGAQPKS